MRNLRRLFVVGWFLAGAVPVSAQGVHCEDDESISSCADRVVFAPVAELRVAPEGADTTNIKLKAVADLKKGNTEEAKADQAGTASGGGQARSTVTDMIPWLNMLGLLSDSDASDGTIAADLNFLLPLQRSEITKHNSQLKWVINVSPEPFEPLIAAIPEGVREERTKELENRIKDTGDSDLQYSYNLVNRKLGRDFRRNEPRLSGLIASQLLAAPGKQAELESASLDATAAFNADLAVFIRSLPPTDPAPDGPRSQMALKELGLTPAQRLEVDRIIAKAQKIVAPALAERLKVAQGVITAPGIRTLAALVRHQPQLLFTANKQYRDELVGPESWGAKVTYEHSFVSLSGFFAAARKTDACKFFEKKLDHNLVAYEDAEPCLTALTDYTNHHLEDLETESRWLASLEYKQVDSWQYALPADGVALDLPKHDRLIASAGFGRAVRRSEVKDRVDFEAAYDSNLDDDDNYKSRFVVTLTYTRRFGDMDIPFSIVYANKSEFLEGTDQQIGLHVGLKYRALDKEQ